MTKKEKWVARLNEAKTEEKNLRAAVVNGATAEERQSAQEALDKVIEKIADINAIIAELDEPADDNGARSDEANENNNDERGMNIMETMEMRNGATVQTNNEKAEARAKAFAESGRMTIENAEARAVLVSSGTLATPTEVNGINDIVGAKVSSIIDLVKITDASGMGAYKVAYLDGDATAATQTEGGEYNASDATFNFVEITPQTEAVISYISEQAQKQTPLNYEAKVNESALVALRKRAAKIATDKILASDLNTKLTGIALDEKFLRTVALSYGGDESIIGAATLFINKTDLVTLGDVRGSDKKPVYEITPDASNPNTGVIKDGGLSVAYCIDSNLTSGTTIYGQAKCFELGLFSNYDIKVSEDFMFNKGMLAIRGSVSLGGNVVVKGGFVVTTNA
jgi:HK97 family phage major capsid protein